MSTTSLHITLAQLNPIVGNIDYNLNKIKKCRDEAPATTNLIIYPELALCGYPPEDLVLKQFFLDRVQEAVDTLVAESARDQKYLAISVPQEFPGAI
ncbi:MAG TPA: hypothetical protein VGD95_07505, partial [Micavibrio sp.]